MWSYLKVDTIASTSTQKCSLWNRDALLIYQSIMLHDTIPIVTIADDVFVLPAVEPGVGPAVQQVGDEPVAQSGPVAEDDIPTEQITFINIISTA